MLFSCFFNILKKMYFRLSSHRNIKTKCNYTCTSSKQCLREYIIFMLSIRMSISPLHFGFCVGLSNKQCFLKYLVEQGINMLCFVNLYSIHFNATINWGIFT